MKTIQFRKDDCSATLDMESKEKFSTSQRFALTMAAIIGTTIVFTVSICPAPAMAFFGALAIIASITVCTLSEHEKEAERWSKMYR